MALVRNGSQTGSRLTQNSRLMFRQHVRVREYGRSFRRLRRTRDSIAILFEPIVWQPLPERVFIYQAMDFPRCDRGNLLFHLHHAGHSIRAG